MIPTKVTPAISKSAYATLRDLVRKDVNYAATSVEQLGPQYAELGIPMGAVWSIRNTLIKQKIVAGHFRIQGSRGRVLADYNNETDICNMSRKWDYPPRCLLRAIFVWSGKYTNREINLLFNSRTPPVEILSPYDLKQYETSRTCDAEPSEIDVASEAQANEDAFVARFTQYPHKLQRDLLAEQIAAYGKAIITPDILFTRPVTINGEFVVWMDYKSFVGVPGTFITKKIRQQAAKYTHEYGPGIIVFRGGYVEGMKEAIGAVCMSEADFDV